MGVWTALIKFWESAARHDLPWGAVLSVSVFALLAMSIEKRVRRHAEICPQSRQLRTIWRLGSYTLRQTTIDLANAQSVYAKPVGSLRTMLAVKLRLPAKEIELTRIENVKGEGESDAALMCTRAEVHLKVSNLGVRTSRR